MTVTARLERLIDTSGGVRRLRPFVASLRDRVAPTHWTNLFGVVTIACVAVLFVTGVILMFFYTPSSDSVVYQGSYAPLHGVEMSKAFSSMLTLSIDVRGGLLLRQAHHWAALLLPTSIIAQLLVTFFTGAFRRPRQWMWVLLFLTLITALVAGWSGYALPDDMLSGTGLRIVEGIMVGIPVVGPWAVSVLFGGGFPGQVIENIYPIHLIVSVALVGVIAARVRSGWAHGPQHFVGRPDARLPIVAGRASRLFVAVCVILTVMAATVTVSPIWLSGPSDPGNVSAGSQPDWYTGFLDGALRLVPPGWEVDVFGGTVSLAVLVPLAVVGAFLAAVAAYPFLEGRFARTTAGRDSALLNRPRTAPARTAIGVAGMAFYGVLWGAASSDLIATTFRLSIESVIMTFQVLLIVGPLIAFNVARRVCFGLLRKDRELLLHGYDTGRIVRMPGGECVEQHLPVPATERLRLLDADYELLAVGPSEGAVAIDATAPREPVSP